ncbi:MAG: response regulator [Desulfobacterales bacterium]
MNSKVLIVDDDAAWLKAMLKELEEHSGSFSVTPAYDGKEALEILASGQISLVVSDLRMPNIDGFELLNRVLRQYPDIPVIIITAYDRPKTREVVIKSGADEYLTKPFTAGELAEKINRLLQKKSEGGSLHNVSLETFLQLIEMEQQTCTLRVLNKNASKIGVLFFRDGDLMNARLDSRLGKEAAYEILSWSGVSVSIQNGCPFAEKQLEGELQAILLDAMRTKDESSQDFNPEEDAEEKSSTGEILLETPADNRQEANPGGKTKTASPEKTPEKPGKAKRPASGKRNDVQQARGSAEGEGFKAALHNEKGVEDIYEDPAWHSLIKQASSMGRIFDAGRLSAIYLNSGKKWHAVIVPGEQASVILMHPDTSRDRIIDAVM